MIVSGSFAIGGLNRWTSRQDKLNIKRDSEMKQLRERVRKLEQQMRRKKAS